jgi:hypothetical protein
MCFTTYLMFLDPRIFWTLFFTPFQSLQNILMPCPRVGHVIFHVLVSKRNRHRRYIPRFCDYFQPCRMVGIMRCPTFHPARLPPLPIFFQPLDFFFKIQAAYFRPRDRSTLDSTKQQKVDQGPIRNGLADLLNRTEC